MAWMRPMGAESVAYHAETVLSRGDDHPGQALSYYGSRGETPLVWGGRGAVRLGLQGTVDDQSYEAIFGPRGCQGSGNRAAPGGHHAPGDRAGGPLREVGVDPGGGGPGR